VRRRRTARRDGASAADLAPRAPRRHTSAEIAGKAKAALTNAGGGKDGLKDRLGGASVAGHSRFLCQHCKAPVTSLAQAKIHHDARHEKLPFLESDYFDAHEAVRARVSPPATRGDGAGCGEGGRARSMETLTPRAPPPRTPPQAGGVTTAGIAVRGTTNAEKLKKKAEKE